MLHCGCSFGAPFGAPFWRILGIPRPLGLLCCLQRSTGLFRNLQQAFTVEYIPSILPTFFQNPDSLCCLLRDFFLFEEASSQWCRVTFLSIEIFHYCSISFRPLSKIGRDKIIVILEQMLIVLSVSSYIHFCHMVNLQSSIRPVAMVPRVRLYI